MNTNKSGTSKKSVIIISVILGVLIVICGFLVYELIKYLDEVPVITSESPVHADVGTYIGIDSLAEFEKASSVGIYPEIEWISDDASSCGAEVSEDGQSLYVGLCPGKFNVTVYAVGENSEIREEKVTVEIYIPN